MNESTEPDPGRVAALTHEVVRRFDTGEFQLPLLPSIAQRMRSFAEPDDPNLLEIASLIHKDMALAAHVLRIANSPAHAPHTRITSLHQAINHLGMRRISDITSQIVDDAGVQDPELVAVTAEIAQHALATALFARELAQRQTGLVSAEVAYLAGLLHDIGRPIIHHILLDVSQYETISAADAGQVAMDLHGWIGASLAEHWLMSDEIALAVRHHHDEPSKVGHRVPTIALLVRMADLLADVALERQAPERPHKRAIARALKGLGYPAFHMRAAFARREEFLAIIGDLQDG